MCRALIADQRMAGIVLNSGARSLRAEPAVVSAVCAEPANGGNMYAALAIIVADKDQTPAAPAAQRMLDAVTTPRVHVPGIVEFAGGWQEAATLTRALQPPDRARLADAMTAVISDTEEPAINRQLALAALANVGRYLSDADRDRFFPSAIQAARGYLASSTDDDAGCAAGWQTSAAESPAGRSLDPVTGRGCRALRDGSGGNARSGPR